MMSHFLKHQQPQNSILDSLLLCDEERLDDDFDLSWSSKDPVPIEATEDVKLKRNPLTFFEHDVLWEDDELVSLLSKEKKQACLSYGGDGSLKAVRNKGIEWMLEVVAHYGYSCITGVLAVNYFDRFVTSNCFQKDKPWMSQLAAVACVSLAAKVEETHVPLLLDFQVVDCKYVFEAKTIQRMEVLVLSTLGWRMNPVTPITFFDHIVRRFELMGSPHWEFLRRCESAILTLVTDCRLLHYLPSVIAAATMINVMEEIKASDAQEFRNRLMEVLKVTKEDIDGCRKMIAEAMEDRCRMLLCRKRRYDTVPGSPSGVIDAYFSSDNSNDSWASASVASSVSSSPEPLLKRSRAL